tara:strand:+ start:366 stop:614 length:249 start_codon:yes stop_codon:yes gene_type:complete
MNRSGKAISLPAKETYTIKTSVKHNPKITPKALKKNFINQIMEYVEALLGTNLDHYVISFYLFISYFSQIKCNQKLQPIWYT